MLKCLIALIFAGFVVGAGLAAAGVPEVDALIIVAVLAIGAANTFAEH